MLQQENEIQTAKQEGPASGSGGALLRGLLFIATCVLVPIILLGGTEVVLRICGFGFPTTATRPCTDRGVSAYCDNQFFTTPFFPPGMLRTPRPYAFPANKPPGTYRIFILGESAAWGDPDPSYGFARYLEVMLRKNYPDVKFEIINTSITATNSHVLLPLARDIAQYQPDLFIIYAGNNEVVGPFGPGTVLTAASSNLGVIRARIFLNSTRLTQFLGSLGRGKQKSEWHGMEMFLEQQVRADSPRLGAVQKNFAANLRDIIAVARHSGARVLISTVATNLKDCAPFASLHRGNLRPEELRTWEDLVQRGAAFEQSGSYANALELYREAGKIDPQYAELHFRIARSLWALGDFAAAKEQFVQAQDLDTLRFRTDSKLDEVIRSEATAAGSGVTLIDAATIFADESSHGIPGDELFYEHVHMNPHGNYVLARALFTQVSAMLPQSRSLQAGDIPTEDECDRFLALTRYDRARVAAMVLRKLEHPPFTNQLNRAEEVSRLTSEAEASSEDYPEVLAAYEWAIQQNPQDRLLHLNYGFLLHRYQPADAEQQFRLALPYDNAPVLCNWRRLE